MKITKITINFGVLFGIPIVVGSAYMLGGGAWAGLALGACLILGRT